MKDKSNDTYAAATGNHCDVYQVNIHNPCQFGISLDGNEEGVPMDGICVISDGLGVCVGSVNGSRNIFGSFDLEL